MPIFCTEQKWKYAYLSDRIKSVFYYMVKPRSIHSHFLYEHLSTFRTFWRGAKSLIYLDVWIECVLIDIYVESLLFDSTVPHSKVEWDFLHCVIPFIITVCNISKNCDFNPLNAELNPYFHLLALLGAHPILHISRIRVKGNTFYSYILFCFGFLKTALIIVHVFLGIWHYMWSKQRESMKELCPMVQDGNYTWFMLVNEYR
jgi:hypothetical protein